MQYQIADLVRDLTGLLIGGIIGLAFGLLQQAALRRNEERERSGRLPSGWNLMPGAGVRVAYLVLALALIQLICPMLFADSSYTQWVVSAGVGLGYGWTLLQQLLLRRRQREAGPAKQG
jgi:hypothetical protein